MIFHAHFTEFGVNFFKPKVAWGGVWNINAVNRLDNGEIITNLAKELNDGKSTISDWKKTVLI